MAAVAEPGQASADSVAVPTEISSGLEPDALPAGAVAVSSEEAFHKGVAISVWQSSGGEESNWGRFTERQGACCTSVQLSLPSPCSPCSNLELGNYLYVCQAAISSP